MARGENTDLLYDPPKISKRSQNRFLIIEQEKPAFAPIAQATIKDGRLLFLFEKSDGEFTVHLPSLDGQGRGVVREQKVGPLTNDNWFVNEAGIVWQEGSSIHLQEARGGHETFPWRKSRKIERFFLSDETLYVLWEESNFVLWEDAKKDPSLFFGRPNLNLSALQISSPNPMWEEVEKYQGEALVYMEDRDDKSIIVHDAGEGLCSLTTLSPEGKGETCLLDEETERIIRKDLYGATNNSELKIAPGAEDGHYYYLQKNPQRVGGVDLCWVNLKNLERGVVESLSAREARAIYNHWSEVKLRSSGQDCAIFSPGLLFVVRGGREVLVEQVTTSKKYEEISFSENKILLYAKDGKKYQEIVF